jgi:arylsulfatase
MSTTKAPNFLFLFPDQHRADWLGCNPDLPLRTPNLDKLMARGTRFINTFTPSPLCAPARACLATGRDYDLCGVINNNQNTPHEAPTYYRHLRDAGYEVLGVGKFDIHKADHNWGLDGSNMLDEYGFTGGMDSEGKGDAVLTYKAHGKEPAGPYMHMLRQEGFEDVHYAMYEKYLGSGAWQNICAVTELPDELYCDNWVAAQGMRVLSEVPIGKPWHLVVNFVGPHGPFDVTKDMRERWKNIAFPQPHSNTRDDPALILERRQNYAAMIENIDRLVGEFIKRVEERGELENTIIVFSSDHGEMLGDHGRWMKSVWYHPASNVPMIIAGPGIPKGRTSEALISLHDLGPTFLDLAGVKPLPNVEARSFRDALGGGKDHHRDFVLSGLKGWRMIFDGRYKLVKRMDEPPLLFDLKKDPNELHNLAEIHPQKVRALERLMPYDPPSNPSADGAARSKISQPEGVAPSTPHLRSHKK